MSQAHAAKFIEFASRDRAMLARLCMDRVTDEASAEIFLKKAVEEGKTQGLDFTADEARGFLTEQFAKQSAGELSDTQLEHVSGGAGGKKHHGGGGDTLTNWSTADPARLILGIISSVGQALGG